MLIWVLWYRNDIKVSHGNQYNASSNMKLVTSLMNFECQPCGILEVFSYHQEDEVIAPTIFAASVGLVEIINNLVSPNFMSMVSLFSVIFDTGYTYSCSSNCGALREDFPKKAQRHSKRPLDLWIWDCLILCQE